MISFTVFGKPEPQGSTRAFIPKGWKRPIITTANAKMKPWRQEISRAAFDLSADLISKPTGVSLRLHFFLAKPQSKARTPICHSVKPDLDKLCRAVSDALTGILFEDDSQIVRILATKQYGLPERVEISLTAMHSQELDCARPSAVNTTLSSKPSASEPKPPLLLLAVAGIVAALAVSR